MTTRFTSLALLAGLAGAPAIAAADTAPVAAEVTNANAPAPASPAATSTYAAREAQDKQAADFQGGNTVVIMSGTALVALILLILII